MALDKFLAALETLEERACCSGEAKIHERVAIALPDGDVGAADDPNFVTWLVAHAELAPYGHGAITKIDPKVRSAHRLIARGAAQIHGFDPSSVLGEVETALSPTHRLSAQLTDVIVYRKGDKFTRHKDTPRSPALIGTLVVGLPVEHRGGAFVVDDGRDVREFDWSGTRPTDVLPWVALFSDVDHEIKPVEDGARVTLVYALHRTAVPRTDAGARQRHEQLAAAMQGLSNQKSWPILIPCSRHVIMEPDAPQPQAIDTLRGADRDIAEVLAMAGYQVSVRACAAAIPNYDDPQRWPATADLMALTRFKSAPPRELMEAGEDGDHEIEQYILDDVEIERCAIRRSAAATLVHENGAWAPDGMDFGNEGFDALLYMLAAIEVTPKKVAKKKPKA